MHDIREVEWPDNSLLKGRDSVVDAEGNTRSSDKGLDASTNTGETFRESIAMDSDINVEEVCACMWERLLH